MESEWLISNDPAAMLACFAGSAIPPATVIGDRKLLLWVFAVQKLDWADVPPETQNLIDTYGYAQADGLISADEVDRLTGSDPATPLQDAQGILQTITRRQRGVEAANLLREIVGNPFRPIGCADGEDYESGLGIARSGIYPPHLDGCDRLVRALRTLTVLSLVQAAYDDCQSNGALDPVRLAILADALEEAGCADEQCKACNGVGAWDPESGEAWYPCKSCQGTGRLPHPLLVHLRSPGLHVRGCWAVDCILNKE